MTKHPRTKKKSVKAWLLLDTVDGTWPLDAIEVYKTRRSTTEPQVPCTITYTLPTSPHKQ